MNQFIFMGRLTKDPDMLNAAGKTIAKFSIAVDRRFQKDTTDYFDCTAFGKTAEFVEKYLKKGVKVIVYGEVHNHNYTNKEGKKIYSNSYIVENVEFCESKKQEEQQEPKEKGWENIPEGNDEELPFV